MLRSNKKICISFVQRCNSTWYWSYNTSKLLGKKNLMSSPKNMNIIGVTCNGSYWKTTTNTRFNWVKTLLNPKCMLNIQPETNFTMVNGSLNNLSFCSPLLLRIHFITCKYCFDPIRQHYRLNTIFKGILQKIGIFYIHNPKSCFCVCIPVKIKQVLGCSGISEKKQTNIYFFFCACQ